MNESETLLLRLMFETLLVFFYGHEVELAVPIFVPDGYRVDGAVLVVAAEDSDVRFLEQAFNVSLGHLVMTHNRIKPISSS